VVTCACICVMQSSPVIVVDSGTYSIKADAYCPDTTHTVLPMKVTLMSQKAYFILVSGQPPRAKRVSNLFTRSIQIFTLYCFAY